LFSPREAVLARLHAAEDKHPNLPISMIIFGTEHLGSLEITNFGLFELRNLKVEYIILNFKPSKHDTYRP